MSLDVSKLKNVRVHGDKTTARCPACAEAGQDQTRNHLVIQADGRFGCVVYPGDSADASAHRKRIFALCGDREIKPLAVHRSGLGRVPVGLLGRVGRVNQSLLAGTPIKSDLLGRLGRVFQTLLATDAPTKKTSGVAEKLIDFGKGVPCVPIVPTNGVCDDADVLFPHLHASTETYGHQGETLPCVPALWESEIVQLLKQAAELGVRPGNKLTVQPIERCPEEFLEILRAYKWYLLFWTPINARMARPNRNMLAPASGTTFVP
jgi:hypothetical protein